MHLRRRLPLRPGPLLLRARRGRAAAAAGAVVAARVQDEALPLRRFRVPLLRRRPLPVRAHGPRAGVPLHGVSCVCDDAGRGAPVRAAASRKNAGPEVQDAHVPLRRGRVPLRRELLLRAQRRRFSARNSTLCGVFMRVGPRAGGAPAARARRAAGRADRRRQPARAAPRPPRRRQPLGGRVRGAQAAGPARAGLVRGPNPGAAGAGGAAAAAAPVAAAAGRLHAARDGDAAARGAATAGVRPAAAVRRGAGAAARVRRSTACTSRLRRAAATVRVGPAATAAAAAASLSLAPSGASAAAKAAAQSGGPSAGDGDADGLDGDEVARKKLEDELRKKFRDKALLDKAKPDSSEAASATDGLLAPTS